jgi:hypothetical protein
VIPVIRIDCLVGAAGLPRAHRAYLADQMDSYEISDTSQPSERSRSMKTTRNWKTIAGLVLHFLIAGIMILSGSPKLLGMFPPEAVAQLGLGGWIRVIGAGELATAILLLIPPTSSLGVLLASSFWGGAICLHMSKATPFVLQSALLLLTWVGAYLRLPGMFRGCSATSPVAQPGEVAAEAVVS